MALGVVEVTLDTGMNPSGRMQVRDGLLFLYGVGLLDTSVRNLKLFLSTVLVSCFRCLKKLILYSDRYSFVSIQRWQCPDNMTSPREKKVCGIRNDSSNYSVPRDKRH